VLAGEGDGTVTRIDGVADAVMVVTFMIDANEDEGGSATVDVALSDGSEFCDEEFRSEVASTSRELEGVPDP
jgi:hypothetical protein